MPRRHLFPGDMFVLLQRVCQVNKGLGAYMHAVTLTIFLAGSERGSRKYRFQYCIIKSASQY